MIAAATEEPARFCAIFAGLLPREVDIDVTVVKVADALAAYRLLRALPQSELRRLHEENQGDAD